MGGSIWYGWVEVLVRGGGRGVRGGGCLFEGSRYKGCEFVSDFFRDTIVICWGRRLQGDVI